jgi:UPF0271 protein
MRVEPADLERLVLYQISALAGIVSACGGRLRHVKPHGALYNDAAQDAEKARAVARAVARLDKQLIFVGLAGSQMQAAANAAGLRFAAEAFCDRAYETDGSLRRRSLAHALHADPAAAASQALDIALHRRVTCGAANEQIEISAQTICVHGDTPGAVAIARAVRQALAGAGVLVKALD